MRKEAWITSETRQEGRELTNKKGEELWRTVRGTCSQERFAGSSRWQSEKLLILGACSHHRRREGKRRADQVLPNPSDETRHVGLIQRKTISSCRTELVTLRFTVSHKLRDTSKRHSRIYSKLILYIPWKWKVDYNTASIQAKQTVYIPDEK